MTREERDPVCGKYAGIIAEQASTSQPGDETICWPGVDAAVENPHWRPLATRFSQDGTTMDWNTLLTTVVIIVFIVLMMRGCGGMMAGGGCGMGRPRRRDQAKPPESSTPDQPRRS